MYRHETSLGGTTFAYFTRNPRGGNAKALDDADVGRLKEALSADPSFGRLVAHAPYTLNLASAKEEVREFSLRAFQEDLMKVEQVPGQYFNFHPGSHLGSGMQTGIERIADALNASLKADQTTTVLLETMAGKGTEVGRSFEELREIIDRVYLKEKIGVCLDTCHVWDGGYDIRNRLDEVLTEFDKVIGLSRLKAIHLNDSKNPLGAHKDRHEKLGMGEIGEEALLRVVRHPALSGKPFILETPNDDEGYKREIRIVREAMVR